MRSLIVRRGLSKRAAPEDGPSFEQQFGILANAVVVDKFPQLDKMRLAFQLIEKTDDNSSAVGAVVYLIGRSVAFVPAFYKGNKLITGDMLFVAQTNQFIPLSDAWINWLRNKDLSDAGEMVENDGQDMLITPGRADIKDINDPIMKTASASLRELLHSGDGDLLGRDSGINILDAALYMGKKASESMLDNLIRDRRFLNATLEFYSGEQLDSFAKTASAFSEMPIGGHEDVAELILPLDKSAATLSPDELEALNRDGYFIRKRAASGSAKAVIRRNSLDGKFARIDGAGSFGALTADGGVRTVTVLKCEDLTNDRELSLETAFADLHGCTSAADFMQRTKNDKAGRLVAVSDGGIADIPYESMCIRGSEKPFSDDMLSGIGKALDGDIGAIPSGSVFVIPGGTCYEFCGARFQPVKYGKGWSNGFSVLSVADDGLLKKPVVTSDCIRMPKGTRIILKEYKPIDESEGTGADVAFITFSMLPAFIGTFCDRTYHKAKVYSNGSEIIVSGDKSPEVESPMSRKEAAMHLVCDYDVSPEDAKLMLKEASAGATYDTPKAVHFLIQKTAADLDDPNAANLPMSTVHNKAPESRSMSMPSQLESPEQLTQAVQTAAQQGIKEVFDVTTLKLLVRQSQLFDDIKDDMPLFMKVLDSLCRKLFQYYWHTDKMEEKYGLVKMKSLEESLKATLDNLSELTMFFKQRTVDGSGITGDVGGDLVNQ